MSRIASAFSTLRDRQEKAFIPYIMAGDPSIDQSISTMHALADNGADIIEIGFPFSDPTADGPTIQQAGIRSLNVNTTLQRVIDCCATFRQHNRHTPLVMMGYANPAMQYGYDRFARALNDAGVDGVIIVDLPPEEEQELVPALKASNVDMIRLIAPTTHGERLARLLENASGFVYVISIKGITGTQSIDDAALKERVHNVRELTNLPIVAGFGIKHADHASAIKATVDGVVVGSALVEKLHKTVSPEDASACAATFSKSMKDALLP